MTVTPIDAVHQLFARLDRIERKLDHVLTREGLLMSELDDLKKQVAETDSVEQSALILIEGIAARITAAGTDGAALSALSADLKGNSDRLAAAVAANTPPPAATPAPPGISA